VSRAIAGVSAAAVGLGALAVAVAFRSSAPLTSAKALEAQYVRVVHRVSPSVVQIETEAGLGSGVAFDAKGDIVTNAHVVEGARRFTVTLQGGRRLTARLVGAFKPDDLAVVRVGSGLLKPASFSAAKLRVGDIVLAVGNPLGLRSSVTDGIVSALGRTVSEQTGAVLPDVIQTSAAINPGNSGGALVNLDGQVVGIPTLAALDPSLGGSQAVGIGFAIPSETVRDIASQLIRLGRVVNSHRAYLGVKLTDDGAGQGVLVAEVVARGPAAKAGMRVGDVIVSLDGKPVAGYEDLASIMADLKPGRRVRVGVVRRDGNRATLTVTLGSLPGS